MKIETLIKAFEKVLPLYQKAYDEKWEYRRLWDNWLSNGICLVVRQKARIIIYDEFNHHYKHYLKNKFLYKTPRDLYNNKKSLLLAIKFRLDFLKEEIPRLKKLKKQGYTHI